ncbi:MAG: homocysteine S-methyltransferase [Caldilineaceae bacterium]
MTNVEDAREEAALSRSSLLAAGVSPDANPLAPFLNEQGYLILDGALATELERKGADLRDALWSAKLLIEDPGLIKQVHQSYLYAGADVISTASYQATVQGFLARGLTSKEAERLLRLSVKLAVEARDAFWADAANRIERLRPLVAASIGPYGAYLANGAEYTGDYGLSEAELVEFHRTRVEILADTQADLFAFETIPSLAEARAIVALLRDFPDKRAWIAFSCRDGRHVCHGERLSVCTAVADASPQIMATGINCTAPEYIDSLIAEAALGTAKPIVVYPNSGEGWDSAAGEWTGGTELREIAAHAVAWHGAGANLIGGCCRTTPDDIAALRLVMRAALPAVS